MCFEWHCLCDWITLHFSMPRLSNLEKARAIGQVEAGVPQNQVAALFGVSPGTISKLKAKFRETGDAKDRPRSGRPKKTTPQEDRFITLKLPICLVYSLLPIGSWLLLIESCLLLIEGLVVTDRGLVVLLSTDNGKFGRFCFSPTCIHNRVAEPSNK